MVINIMIYAIMANIIWSIINTLVRLFVKRINAPVTIDNVMNMNVRRAS